MSRTLLIVVLALVMAVDVTPGRVTACVPEAAAETPQGADATQASKISEAIAAGGQEVAGRPTTIPGSMGGAVDIGNTGASTGGTAAGTGTKEPVAVTGGSGTAPEGSTVADGPNGTKVVTVPAGKEAKVKGGIFDDGKEARDGAQGTLTGGGTIATATVTTNPDGTIKLEGITKVTPGTGPDAGFRTNGGSPIPPGATVGVTVPEGRDLKDANQRYGE